MWTLSWVVKFGRMSFFPLTSSILLIFSAIPSPPFLTNISAFIVLDKVLKPQSYLDPILILTVTLEVDTLQIRLMGQRKTEDSNLGCVQSLFLTPLNYYLCVWDTPPICVCFLNNWTAKDDPDFKRNATLLRRASTWDSAKLQQIRKLSNLRMGSAVPHLMNYSTNGASLSMTF